MAGVEGIVDRVKTERGRMEFTPTETMFPRFQPADAGLVPVDAVLTAVFVCPID